MNRIMATGFAALFSFGLAACAGEQAGENGTETVNQNGAQAAADTGAQAGDLTTPEWMQVDHDAQTVTMEVTAGSDPTNNRWNFNGYANGDATVVVPQGYEITIEFTNADPNNPHSLGIDERPSGGWPATFQNPTPVFEGAITTDAASMTGATQADESETITFTASQAGEYTMVCYVPAHAATGMWINFNVSADGQAGLQTAS